MRMDLRPSDDQEALRSTLRALFAKHSSSQAVRETEAAEPGWDRALWGRLGEAGMLGATIAGAQGGSGGTPLDAACLAEEAGRALALVPLVEADAIAGRLLAEAAPTGTTTEHLDAMVRGERVVVATVLDHVAFDGRLLHGESPSVPYGAAAAAFLVPVGSEVVLATRGTATTVGRQPVLGPAPVGHVRFDGEAGELLELPEGTVERAWLAGALSAAAVAAGGMAEVLRYAVDYATGRQQFGRPIGSFQALQHRMADMAADAERARLLVLRAATEAGPMSELRAATEAALVFNLDAYVRASASACQVMGGYGFMVEHDAQLHLRAAKSLRLAWPVRPLLRRLGDHVLAASRDRDGGGGLRQRTGDVRQANRR